MNTLRPSPWVPASLLRLRCFLNGRGMKVRPWLGPREVLSAFCGALGTEQRDDTFWTDLRALLADLGRDMQVRAEALGWVEAQELFDSECYEELLAQIRGALKEEPGSEPGFSELVHVLPRRAAALLLVVGAAVSVGCGGEAESTSSSAPATGGALSAGSGGGASGGTASGGVSSVGAGGRLLLAPTGGVGGGAADPVEPPTCNADLARVIGECDNLTDNDKTTLIQCACVLNDAWETGLAALFENADCRQVIEEYFTCCAGSCCRGDPASRSGVDFLCNKSPEYLPAEFDPSLLADNSCCPVYLGVRCG
jgi:hypothetical protein